MNLIADCQRTHVKEITRWKSEEINLCVKTLLKTCRRGLSCAERKKYC